VKSLLEAKSFWFAVKSYWTVAAPALCAEVVGVRGALRGERGPGRCAGVVDRGEELDGLARQAVGDLGVAGEAAPGSPRDDREHAGDVVLAAGADQAIGDRLGLARRREGARGLGVDGGRADQGGAWARPSARRSKACSAQRAMAWRAASNQPHAVVWARSLAITPVA